MRNSILIFAAATALAACGVQSASAPSALNSEDPRGVAALSEGMNGFTFGLYKELTSEADFKGKNVFVSPASVSTAFAMTYLGARGDTAKQMASVLGYKQSPAAIGPNFGELMTDLKADRDVDGYQLRVANKIWAQKDFGFLDSYKTANSTYFQSPIGEVNFRDASVRKAVVGDINQWAFDQTNGKITDVVKDQDVNESTRIMLANAIYFLGDWATPFKNPGENFDRTGPFHRLASEPVDVTYMTHSHPLSYLRYFEDETLQAVELPYMSKDADSQMAMTILLPKAVDGLADLEKNLSAERFGSILSRMEASSDRRISVKLPKWELKSDVIKLKEPLENMGLSLPFVPYNGFTGEGADFSGMTGQKNITLDKVLHKTFIRVDEKGTEAAAVTVIGGFEATSVMPVTFVTPFVADHPFLYTIRNVKTGTILFIGRLLDPSQSK